MHDHADSLELRLAEKIRENQTLRAAQKACEDCMTPTYADLRTRLQKAEELLGEAESMLSLLPDEYIHKDSKQPLCWSPDGCLARIRTFLNQDKT